MYVEFDSCCDIVTLTKYVPFFDLLVNDLPQKMVDKKTTEPSNMIYAFNRPAFLIKDSRTMPHCDLTGNIPARSEVGAHDHP